MKKKGLHKWRWLLIPIVAVLLVASSSLIRGGIDLTSEKRFTISEPTINLLGALKDPVNITVLLEGDELPAGFKKLANATRSFLNDCRSYSNGKLSFSFVTPDEFLADSIRFPLNDTLKASWLKESAIKQNEISSQGTKAIFNYPVALVQTGESYAPVNLLQGQGNKGFLNPDAAGLQLETINNAEAQMEYHFASAIQSLTDNKVPTVAYVVGHGEPMGPETYSLSQTLQSKYNFYLLNLPGQPFISDSLSTLIIVKPSEPFSDADKLKIDQYIMHGGKVLFLLDALHADMDSLVRSGKDFVAYGRNLRLDDQLFRYGVRINQNLVQDRQSDVLPQAVGSVGNEPQIELLPWPYFPLLYSQSSHPIAKNLDAVVMQFPNSLDTVKADGITKNVLLSTSNTSRLIGAPVIVTVEILKQMENASAYKQAGVPTAVLLEGKFRSLFANRMAGQALDSMQANGHPFLAMANSPAKILVTGDGDWVLNSFNKQGPLPMGANAYTGYQFANQQFLLNALDYMNDESGIMASRSKEYVLRVLDPKKLEKQKTIWQWISIGAPLLLLLLAGIVFQWIRRRKFVQ